MRVLGAVANGNSFTIGVRMKGKNISRTSVVRESYLPIFACMMSGCVVTNSPVLHPDISAVGLFRAGFYRECTVTKEAQEADCRDGELVHVKDERNGSYTLVRAASKKQSRITLNRIDVTSWALQSLDEKVSKASLNDSFVYSVLATNRENDGSLVWTPQCYFDMRSVQAWGKRAGAILPVAHEICDFEIMKKSDLFDLLTTLRVEAASNGSYYSGAKQYKHIPEEEGKRIWDSFGNSGENANTR